MSAVQELLDLALAEVGYLEKKSNANLDDFTANAGKNNYTKYASDYKDWGWGNYQAQPWCDMYVSWCFQKAFGDTEVSGYSAYCPSHVNWFKNQKRWHTSGPQKGDVIFFKNSSGVAYHVGIVYNVDKSKVYTVEGNTSAGAGVIENGGGVEKKSYSLTSSSIMGYGRPNYERVKAKDELTAAQYEELSTLISGQAKDILDLQARTKMYKALGDVPEGEFRDAVGRRKFSDYSNVNVLHETVREWVLEDRKRCFTLDDVKTKYSYAYDAFKALADQKLISDPNSINFGEDIIRMTVTTCRTLQACNVLDKDFRPVKGQEGVVKETLEGLFTEADVDMSVPQVEGGQTAIKSPLAKYIKPAGVEAKAVGPGNMTRG